MPWVLLPFSSLMHFYLMTTVSLQFLESWSFVQVCPVVMYGCENWTVKNAEHRRIDAFELRCWRRLLRVPWTARRFNQSILKEISPGISLEEMMLELKLQYFAHLIQRVDSLEKTLILGGIGGRRRRGRPRMRWLDGITDSIDVSLSREAWRAVIHGVSKSRTRLSDWTEPNNGYTGIFYLGGFKIIADGDCSYEIKRCLLLGRKAMTNIDRILKSRHYFINKCPSSQSYGFFQ